MQLDELDNTWIISKKDPVPNFQVLMAKRVSEAKMIAKVLQIVIPKVAQQQ